MDRAKNEFFETNKKKNNFFLKKEFETKTRMKFFYLFIFLCK